MPDSVYPVFPAESAGLMDRLDVCDALPTPPGIAEKILALAEDPGSSVADFAEVVRVDVALAGRLLQLANSPVYGLSREVYDVRHAITVLGLEATLSNALSIALVASIREQQCGGIDFRHFWRRSLASASANRLLARHTRAPVAEHYFMAGLLQDIGMVALASVEPELYASLAGRQADHRLVVETEIACLGIDHALAGAWLIGRWKLPVRYAQAVEGSHDPAAVQADSENDALMHCTAVSGAIADIVYGDHTSVAVRRALGLGAGAARLTPAALKTLLAKLVTELEALGGLFDLDLGRPEWLAGQLQRALAALEQLSTDAEPLRA